MIDIQGWKKLEPITALFRKYQINPDLVKLDFEECFHPVSPFAGRTYADALNNGKVVVVNVYSNWLSARVIPTNIFHTRWCYLNKIQIIILSKTVLIWRHLMVIKN